MFQLPTGTKAKLTDVVVLSQKNRKPEDNPGAKLPMMFTLPNSVLDVFAPGLRAMVEPIKPMPISAIRSKCTSVIPCCPRSAS